SKQETGVDLRYWPFSLLLCRYIRAICGRTLYTNSGRIYIVDPDLWLRLIDAGDETVHCIDDQHGNWRIEDQIENHARLHGDYLVSKEQGHIAEKILHVPT